MTRSHKLRYFAPGIFTAANFAWLVETAIEHDGSELELLVGSLFTMVGVIWLAINFLR